MNPADHVASGGDDRGPDQRDREVPGEVVVVAGGVVDAGVCAKFFGGSNSSRSVGSMATGSKRSAKFDHAVERRWHRVRSACPVAQPVLDVADAQRAADRDEQVHGEVREGRFGQDVVQDDRAETVRDDDLRRRALARSAWRTGSRIASAYGP